MRQEIKILHITPTIFSNDNVIGGGERYVENLIASIKQASKTLDVDIKQKILAMGKGKSESFIVNDSSYVLLPPTDEKTSAFDAIPQGLPEIIKDFDIIHIHQCLTRFAAFCLSVAKSCRKIIIGTDHGGGDDPLLLSGKGIELYDHIIAVSKYSKSLIQPYYSKDVSVIQGPVDSKKFSLSEGKENYGLCVSRILPHKGIDRIVKVLPKDMKLVVVGEVYDKIYFHRLQEMALGKKIVFYSDVEDKRLIEIYQKAKFFFQGSTHCDIFGKRHLKPELMGLAAIEALMCGTPIIVSDAGALPELIKDDRVGNVFHNEDELMEILKEINLGRWMPLRYSKLCHEYADKNYGLLNTGIAVLNIYRELMR